MINKVNSKKIYLECGDYCGILKLTKENFETGQEIFIEYFVNSFYVYQKPGWDSFIRRLKLIWNTLLGKDFSLFEVIIEPDEVEYFKNEMLEFLEDGE